MMGWQWHQLDHMQIICILLQTNNHASTSPLSFFTGRMPFLPSNQQRQSTEGPLTGVKLYCLMIVAQGDVNNLPSRYAAAPRPGVKPASSSSQVRRQNMHYICVTHIHNDSRSKIKTQGPRYDGAMPCKQTFCLLYDSKCESAE